MARPAIFHDSRIPRLWLGLALSAMGDQVYAIALIWFSARLLGTWAGYIGALQAFLICFVSCTFAGRADGYDSRMTMICADLFRALAVLIPVGFALSGHGGAISLVLTVLLLSCARPFYEPALQRFLAAMDLDPDTRRSVNALFDSTTRLSRIGGPAAVAALAPLLPIIHFFTLDSLTFILCAAVVMTLKRGRTDAVAPSRSTATALLGGTALSLLRKQWVIGFSILANAFCSGTWQAGFILGMSLYFQQARGGVSLYSLMILAYGMGNITANIVVGSALRRAPALPVMSMGRIVSGLGFLLLYVAHGSAASVAVCAALAGTGVPLAQVPLTGEIQAVFSGREVARLQRARAVADYSGIFVAMILSPLVLTMIQADGLLAITGVTYLGFGALGAALIGHRRVRDA